LKLSLAPWTAGVAGLVIALLFDRFARKNLDSSSFEVWNNVPAWQFWSVSAVFVAVLGAAAYFMLTTFSGDPLCHHGITNSILAFGSPVRDLGSFDRFLPYHALGNSLAAIVASAVESLGGPRAVEASLDIVSLVSLAVFLGVASVLFVLLLGVFTSSRRPGPLWICFVLPLLVFGAGPVALAHLMPDVLNSADCYPEFAALTFHPLIQYLGRRSAVPAFAIFIVLLCTLLLASDHRFARKWVPVLLMSACFVGLSYSSLDMFAVAVVLLFAGLCFRDLRPSALLGLAGLAAAAPLIAAQGGFFTASLFNQPLPEAKSFFSWELRAPALVGFFKGARLAGVPLTDPFALKALFVEFPWFVVSLISLPWILAMQRISGPRSWLILIAAVTLIMLVAPFFVFFVFSPWDIHRLFFWPTLFAAILTPYVLLTLPLSRRARLSVALLLLFVGCSSAIARHYILSPNANERLLGYAASEFEERIGFDPQGSEVWISSTGGQELLFMNGCRVLAPPFGTAGPVYYLFPHHLFDAHVQGILSSQTTGGATMALLTPDDLAFLHQRQPFLRTRILSGIHIQNRGRTQQFFVVRLSQPKDSD
jgi:hypothetical protein